MEVIRNQYLPRYQNSVVTIGNFDGVHGGHQIILQEVINEARSLNVAAGVITFEPHPAEFFRPERAAARLTPLREKYKVLKEMGLDFVVVLPFNQTLAMKTAREFVETILIKRLAVKSVWIGDDFHFGRNREGDFTLLNELAKMGGFTVNHIATIEQNNQRISSTRLRELLKQGDMDTASQLLGRYYILSGRVQQGAQRGQQLGFPTANIRLLPQRALLSGVFAVQATSPAFSGIKRGVANIGTRPTVDGLTRLLEVHLFDFDASIYGQRLDVEFVAKLRDEKKFDSLDELKAQIQRDVEKAKGIFLDLV